MPGCLVTLTTGQATGWAVHPALPGYRPLVHAAHRSLIVRSVIADLAPPPGQEGESATGHWFAIELGRLHLTPADTLALRFTIGETDELLSMPAGLPARAPGPVTVEDILAQAHTRRAWVTGQTYVEATASGLRTDTIVDMLYRDYLGRAADPNGLAHYASSLDSGTLTYDDIRRAFVEADEYRLRRKYVDTAPGTIFSQRIVLAAAPGEQVGAAPAPAESEVIPASELLAIDGDVFVTACYARILRKEVDPAGLAHYRGELARGVSKIEIIRHLASELEAITAGITVTGLKDVAPAPAP